MPQAKSVKPATRAGGGASWSIETWPEHVWPGSPIRARYLIRTHRDDLLRSGALARVGRELVILGPRFERWLQKQSANVPGYECPANRSPDPL